MYNQTSTGPVCHIHSENYKFRNTTYVNLWISANKVLQGFLYLIMSFGFFEVLTGSTIHFLNKKKYNLKQVSYNIYSVLFFYWYWYFKNCLTFRWSKSFRQVCTSFKMNNSFPCVGKYWDIDTWVSKFFFLMFYISYIYI